MSDARESKLETWRALIARLATIRKRYQELLVEESEALIPAHLDEKMRIKEMISELEAEIFTMNDEISYFARDIRLGKKSIKLTSDEWRIINSNVRPAQNVFPALPEQEAKSYGNKPPKPKAEPPGGATMRVSNIDLDGLTKIELLDLKKQSELLAAEIKRVANLAELCRLIPTSGYAETVIDLTRLKSLKARFDSEIARREGISHAPEQVAEAQGQKYTALTARAKGRLNEIRPAIAEFYESLKARIQKKHKTMVNANSRDWEKQANSLLKNGGSWKEIITKADIQKVSFDTLADSEHKERFKINLAQIILEREGFGRINRNVLKF